MTKELIERNPIVKHSLEFALMINAYAPLIRQLHNWDLARQLFKSGTSIGANVWEAQDGESKADFIHKMKIAAKEANETQFWLILCGETPNYPDCKHLKAKLEEIQKILSSIISTSKRSSPISFLIGHLLFLWKPTTTLFVASQI
ncbi:MAG: four helix bundle protein [Saprospiraceae bacterium]